MILTVLLPGIHDDNQSSIIEHVLCCGQRVCMLSFTINPTASHPKLRTTSPRTWDNAAAPQNSNSATPTTIIRLALTTHTSPAQRKAAKSWQHCRELDRSGLVMGSKKDRVRKGRARDPERPRTRERNSGKRAIRTERTRARYKATKSDFVVCVGRCRSAKVTRTEKRVRTYVSSER